MGNLGDFLRSMRGQKLSQLKDAMYSILRDMKGEENMIWLEV